MALLWSCNRCYVRGWPPLPCSAPPKCLCWQGYRPIVFESMQQTKKASAFVQHWLKGRLPASVKVSLPLFNQRAMRGGVELRALNVQKEALNVPVYGLQIPQASLDAIPL